MHTQFLGVDVVTDLVFQLIADDLYEIRTQCFNAAQFRRFVGYTESALFRVDRCVGRDVLLRGHEVEHEIAAIFRPRRTAARVVVRRRFGHRRKQRCFMQLQLAGRLAEVVTRRGLNAVRAATEIDVIEI